MLKNLPAMWEIWVWSLGWEDTLEEGKAIDSSIPWAFLVSQRLKRLPVMQETRVPSLAREDALEKEMATLSSNLAWTIPWTQEPGRLQSAGSQRVGHDWATSLSFLSFEVITERVSVCLLPFLSSECSSSCLSLQFYQFHGLSYPPHLLYPKLLCLELFGGRGFSALPTGRTTLLCITVATWDRT